MLHPLKTSSNLFSAIEDEAMALGALATALRATDIEAVEDPDIFIRHMGYLANTISGPVLALAEQGKRNADYALAALPVGAQVMTGDQQ